MFFYIYFEFKKWYISSGNIVINIWWPPPWPQGHAGSSWAWSREGFQVLPAEARGPQHLDLVDQLGQGPNVLSPQLVFHKIPAILYGIQVQAIPWLVDDLE